MFLLVRHAKSDRPAGVPDLDRPLSARGRADASLLGGFLAGVMPAPEVMLVSPASRARETAELVAVGAGWNGPIVIVEALYHGGVSDLIGALRAQAASPIVAFGHEPTWSDTVEVLTGAAVHMVTAAAVCLEGDPAPGGALLTWMITPALIGGGRA